MTIEIERKTLKTGEQVALVHRPGATVGSVQMWFRAGSALEEKGDFGVAHFLEHMFFKGTETRPRNQIAQEIEELGGELNAFTSFDYTCYYMNTPNESLPKTLEILIDMVSAPTFDQEELLPEREVVHEEWKRAKDNPNQSSFHQIQKLSFQGPYAHQILGTQESIQSFTREQISNFRERFYNKQNALLVIAGDLSERDQLNQKLESLSLPSGEVSHFPTFQMSQKNFVHAYHFDVRMAKISLVIQAPDYSDPAASSEDLALNCLASGETSPLYQNLISKGPLAIGLGASTLFFAKGGCHFISVSCPVENIQKVFTEMKKVLKEAMKKGVDPKLLKRIKNQYMASKIYEKESLESFAFSLGHGFAQCKDIYADEKFIERSKNVDPSDIKNALNSLFQRKAQVYLQLPKDCPLAPYKKSGESFLKTLSPPSQKSSTQKRKTQSKTSKFDPSAQVIKLKEGIDLIHRFNPLTPTFSLHAFVTGGLTRETNKTNGLYSLSASLLSKGHLKASNQKLKSILEDHAAHLNGFSGRNAYGLSLHGQSAHSNLLFSHFFQSLLTPRFSQKELKQEIAQTLRGLEAEKEDPVKMAFKAFSAHVHKGHSYALPMSGTGSSLSQYNQEKVLRPYQRGLKKEKIVISYSGSQDLKWCLKEVTSALSSLPARKYSAKKTKGTFGAEPQHIHLPFEREQTQILMGQEAPPMNTTEGCYLKILTTYLSGQSSPLFTEVRDKRGLCYAVQPFYFNGLERGHWGIYIGVGLGKEREALTCLKDLLTGYAQGGLSEETFETTKNMIRGHEALSMQTNDDFAQTYALSTLHGFGIDHHYQVLKQIDELDHNSFKSYLSHFLSREWTLITAGKKKEEF